MVTREWQVNREKYLKCLSKINLEKEDAKELALELIKLSKCEIFPPILPSSIGKAKYAKERYRLIKEASGWTLKLAEAPRSVWLYRRIGKLIVRVINESGMEYSVSVNCGSFSLINAQWYKERYPIFSFQIPSDCVIIPIIG